MSLPLLPVNVLFLESPIMRSANLLPIIFSMLVKVSPSASPPLKVEKSKFIDTAELDVE